MTKISNIFILKDMEDEVSEYILPALAEHLFDDEINIWINSDGGLYYLAIQIIEMMEVAKRAGTIVRTIVSRACSAASMVAVAGSPGERYVSEYGEYLLHYGNSTSDVLTPRQSIRVAERTTRRFGDLIDLYKKYTNVPDLETHMEDDCFYIDAAKAIQYNIADHYTSDLKFVLGDDV